MIKLIYMKSTLSFLKERGLEIIPNAELTDVRHEKEYYVLTDKEQKDEQSNNSK